MYTCALCRTVCIFIPNPAIKRVRHRLITNCFCRLHKTALFYVNNQTITTLLFPVNDQSISLTLTLTIASQSRLSNRLSGPMRWSALPWISFQFLTFRYQAYLSVQVFLQTSCDHLYFSSSPTDKSRPSLLSPTDSVPKFCSFITLHALALH